MNPLADYCRSPQLNRRTPACKRDIMLSFPSFQPGPTAAMAAGTAAAAAAAASQPPRVCASRYVKKPYDKAGTALKLVVRGKANDATVTKMPFVKTTYYKP